MLRDLTDADGNSPPNPIEPRGDLDPGDMGIKTDDIDRYELPWGELARGNTLC